MKAVFHAIPPLAILALCLGTAVFFLYPRPLSGQSLNLRKQATGATAAEQGMPERGRFQFIYSYSGEAIDATITLTKNGAVIAEQSGLAPVSDATLADIAVQRGDVLVFTQSFGVSSGGGPLAGSLAGYPQGVWAGQSSGRFFLIDENGTITGVLGAPRCGCRRPPPSACGPGRPGSCSAG